MALNKRQTAKKVARQEKLKQRLTQAPDAGAAAARAKVRARQIRIAGITGGAAGEAAARSQFETKDAQTAKNVAKLRANMTRVANTPVKAAPNFKYPSKPATRRNRSNISANISKRPHLGVGGLGRNMFFN